MLYKNACRLIAAGSVAASRVHRRAPPPGRQSRRLPRSSAQPLRGTATSGVPGGTITATATWSPYNKHTFGITGYRVRATRVDLFAPGSLMMSSDTLNATTSAMQPGSARSLSMTLPSIGTYTFQVQAINEVGGSSYSAASNRVTGQ